ncbi:hypothetical protein D1BOALGB6SA_6877 [Olavius sp. associated proteobacterium Delta 1]|nr:hypothetical protein D1BOALGB6SA_6877 [Olavius sp. associated proteobacterium Delta 1]
MIAGYSLEYCRIGYTRSLFITVNIKFDLDLSKNYYLNSIAGYLFELQSLDKRGFLIDNF